MNGLNNKAKQVLKTPFFKNIVTQLLGTGIAQLIPVLATLLLAKLYNPADFALYTNFIAVSAVLMVMVGGNYHFAIVLPKKDNDKEANNIFIISLLITFILAILIGLISFVFKSTLETTFGLKNALFYLPLYVFTYGFWMGLTNLAIRQLKFKSIAIAKVIQAIVYSIVSILIGYYIFRSTGLIIGKWLGVLGGVIFLLVTTRFTLNEIDFTVLKEVAKRYINYPKFGIFPALLNTISLQAMVFTLQIFYSEDILGYYGFTILVLTAPLALIGASFKDVFYQKMAFLINEQKFSKALRLFKNSSITLSIIAFLMAMILFGFGEPLFELFFGEKWNTSGYYASILAFSFAVKLVVSPLSSIFNATNNLKKAAIWQTGYFGSTIILLFVCASILKLPITNLLWVYMIHEVLLYLIYFVIQSKLIQKIANQ